MDGQREKICVKTKRKIFTNLDMKFQLKTNYYFVMTELLFLNK